MTEIIIKKREVDENEFLFNPITTFSYVKLRPLFSYIERHSNLIITDVSEYTDDRKICFRVEKVGSDDGEF
jgi:hypothetical protein